MFRAVFYDLRDRFAVHAIAASRTFDPEFRPWSEDELSSLTEFDLVMLHLPAPDRDRIRGIRQALHFANIQFVVLLDAPDAEACQAVHMAGADECLATPPSDEALIAFLQEKANHLKNAQSYENELIEAFKQAALEIFATMAFMQVEHVQTYRNELGKLPVSDLNASMQLIGRESGAIMLALPEALARQIISGIMAIPLDDMGPDDLKDGVGELANMIAGGAKARISEAVPSFTLSTPAVAMGQACPDERPEGSCCVVMVFRANDEYLAVQVCMPCLVG